MATDSILNVRVDSKLKKRATKILKEHGLSLSTAIRIFLIRVIADECLPFELHVPNAETSKVIDDAKNSRGVTRVKDTQELFNRAHARD